jgi:hypothetical protein
MNTGTRYSMCLNIDGFVRNERYPQGYKDLFIGDDGHTLTPAEARAFLALEKAKGRKVIPCSSECGSPCQHDGCPGFDYSGSGCGGRPMPAALSQVEPK